MEFETSIVSTAIRSVRLSHFPCAVAGSGTVKGLFLVGGGTASNTKGDHASDGTLWATALFSSGDVVVQNGDQLKVTYTVSA